MATLSELRIKTSKITDAASDLLRTRRIARSDNFPDARQDMEFWDESTFKEVYQDKVIGSDSHWHQVETVYNRWNRENRWHLVHDLNEVKEDYFQGEQSKFLEEIKKHESLKGFLDNYSAEGETFEQQFNHLYHSLADFAERSQQRYDRAVEREKNARLEFKVLRDEVDSLDSNFDWKSLEGHPTWLKNKWLTQAKEDIPSMLYDIEQMKKQTGYSPIEGMSVRKQFNMLSNMIEKNDKRQTLGRELMGLSFEDFNKRMNSVTDEKELKELKRAIYSVDNSFYTELEKGASTPYWFRSGIDQKKYDQLFPPESLSNGKVMTNPLIELKNKTGTEFSQGFEALSGYERSEFAQNYGQPKNFKHGDQTLWYREGDDLSWLSPEEKESKVHWEDRLQVAAETDNETRQTIKNLKEMYREESKPKSFKSNAERDKDIFNNLDELDAEAAAREKGTTKAEELARIKGGVQTPSDEITSQRVSTKQQDIADQVSGVNHEKTELDSVGERGAKGIERKASVNSLLADTARSYTFGYKQKALLGFMGTAGAMTLLEASMNSPSAEVIERRRQLEEERRRKKFGY